MKDKVIIFIIGLLIGAIISTGIFFIYSKNTNCNVDNKSQMNMRDQKNKRNMPSERPNGNNNQNGQPPEMPNGNNKPDNN